MVILRKALLDQEFPELRFRLSGDGRDDREGRGALGQSAGRVRRLGQACCCGGIRKLLQFIIILIGSASVGIIRTFRVGP
jgi:hypothetical protein